MRDKVICFIEFVVGLVILMFFQEYALNVLGNFGINLNNYSNDIVMIVIFVIQILLCAILYFIYKSSIKQNGHGFKNHFLKNLLYSILILAVMTVVMNIGIFFIKYIANMFGVSVVEKMKFNVLQSNLSLSYVLNLVKFAILIPFSSVVVYVLGVERLFRKSGTKIVMGGLIWAVVESLNWTPNLLNMLFNSLPTFILGLFLSYIYSRNKNIWYPIIIYGLYLLFSPLLIGYLGW